MKSLNISFIAIAIVAAILFSGCAAQSKIPFSPAPEAPEGYGSVYVLKEGGGPMAITSVAIAPLDNLDENTRAFYLVQGEYLWVHLKAGMYEATYFHAANGGRIKVDFKVENKKSSYIKLSYANYDYIVMSELESQTALSLLAGYKYWEYKNKKFTLTPNCR